MEIWKKAIKLREYIYYCTPTGYREPIHVFINVPRFTDEEYTILEQAYKEGKLLESIKSFSYLDYPFFITAIQQYFKEFA